MRDLRPDLTNLWRTTARLTAPEGGRVLMFMSARAGEGASSMAASFALMAASKSARAAWLVDLDLRRNSAFRGFEQGFATGAGAPGRAFDASLGEDPIYTVTPQTVSNDGRALGVSKLLSAHQVKGTRLLVTRFRNERLKQGQRVQLRTQPQWWSALRKAADWVIVDTPALERSGAGLAVASQMDGIIIVVGADQTTPEELLVLRREIEAHGGNVIGVVMNRAKSDAKFADRLG